jgi:hypothetical protein
MLTHANHPLQDTAVSYITGGCNENPGVPGKTDEELLLIDTVADFAG